MTWNIFALFHDEVFFFWFTNPIPVMMLVDMVCLPERISALVLSSPI